jgi:hypothetical protein
MSRAIPTVSLTPFSSLFSALLRLGSILDPRNGESKLVLCIMLRSSMSLKDVWTSSFIVGFRPFFGYCPLDLSEMTVGYKSSLSNRSCTRKSRKDSYQYLGSVVEAIAAEARHRVFTKRLTIILDEDNKEGLLPT